jgi:hypothetical protein
MKGDFTRFTFRPEKRYSSVLMQQGRLQLDADWNEQMSIQAYLSQQQILDMIGSSGTPSVPDGASGFQISLTPDHKDLLIQPGRFYLNGILCELLTGNSISATVQSLPVKADTKKTILTIIVPNLFVDGQPLTEGQWVVIMLTGGAGQAQYFFQIDKVDTDQQLLTLVSTDEQLNFPAKDAAPNQTLHLRRLTTYKTQLDRPNASILDLPGGDLKKGLYLVYLDAWQRHITAIEDPEIREAALEVPDTTTRIQTISQIKLLFLGEIDPALSQEQQQQKREKRLQDAWKQLSDRPVMLTARDPSDLKTNGLSNSGQTLDNQLYRVEIHRSGTLDTASFKWSRENGSIVNPINHINDRDNVIEIKLIGQDIAQFDHQPWVEIIDEVRELNNQPGTLVRLTDATLSGKSGKLTFDLTTRTGDAINQKNFPPERKPKIRRWDWTSKDPGLRLKTTASPDAWIDLEKGIQIKFGVPQKRSDAEFQTGDYWLIPSRSDGILWPHDSRNQRQAQSPDGIQHQFAQLALVEVTADEQSKALHFNVLDNRRVVFPTLMNCFDKSGDSISGSLGIGLGVGIKPKARLYVQGNVVKAGQGVLSCDTGSTVVKLSGSTTPDQIHVGDVIQVDGLAQELRVVVAIAGDGSLIVDRPFTTTFSNSGFSYQQPVLRLDNSNLVPQLVLTGQNQVGIGTVAPDAQLTVQGNIGSQTEASSSAALHIRQFNTTSDISKGFSPKSLFYVRNDGAIGIGTVAPDAQLTVQSIIPSQDAAATSAAFHIHQSNLADNNNNSLFHVRNDGNIGISITPSDAKLHINGIVKIGTVDSFLQLSQEQTHQIAAFNASPNITQYQFDRSIDISSGNFSVKGTTDNDTPGVSVKNSVDNTLFVIRNDGNVGIGLEARDISSLLHVNGVLTIGQSNFLQIAERSPAAIFTTSENIKNYQFDKTIDINSGNLNIHSGSLSIKGTGSDAVTSGLTIKNSTDITLLAVRNDGHVGIGRDPSNDARLYVNGSLKLEDQVNSVQVMLTRNHDGQTDSMQMTLTDEQVNFTTGSDAIKQYQFDRQLLINQGGATIKGDVKIEKTGNTGGSLTVANGLTLSDGDLTLVTGAVKTSAQSLSVQLVGGEGMSISPSEVKIAGKLGLGTTGSVASQLEVVGVADPAQINVPILQVKKADKSALFAIKNTGEVAIGSSDSTGAAGNLQILGNTSSLSLVGTNSSFNLGSNQQFFINTTATQTTLGTTGDAKLVFQTKEISATGDWKTDGRILQVSSRTLKENIVDFSSQEAKMILKGMKPVSFSYKADQTHQPWLGFIAEDLPEAVVSANHQAVDLMQVITVLTKTVQDQQQALASLYKMVKEQQQTIAELKSNGTTPL